MHRNSILVRDKSLKKVIITLKLVGKYKVEQEPEFVLVSVHHEERILSLFYALSIRGSLIQIRHPPIYNYLRNIGLVEVTSFSDIILTEFSNVEFA